MVLGVTDPTQRRVLRRGFRNPVFREPRFFTAPRHRQIHYEIQNLYQIKRGNNRISRDVAQRINTKYPQYSIGWLICGKKGAPPTLKEQELVRIPIYHDWCATFPAPQGPADHVVLSASLAQGAELATPYVDNILNPYLQDSLLLLRRHEGAIIYGCIYFVETRHFRFFRIVTAVADDPKSVCLTTLQPAKFGDTIILQKDKTALWLVTGAVSKLIK